MKSARMLGNYVEYLAEQKGLSVSDLSQALGCDQNKVASFLKGRAYASFSQISNLAKILGASVTDLLAGDVHHYKCVTESNGGPSIRVLKNSGAMTCEKG